MLTVGSLVNEIRSGDLISSVNSPFTITNLGKVTGSSNITITGLTHDSSTTVQGKISSGTAGEKYRIEGSVITTGGDTIEFETLLEVT